MWKHGGETLEAVALRREVSILLGMLKGDAASTAL